MSYYATMSGDITTKEKLKGKLLDELEAFLRNKGMYADAIIGDNDIDFSGCRFRYDEEDLDELGKIIPVENGELFFTGEDDAMWKLLWDEDGGYWVEYNAQVNYLSEGMPSYDQLKEMFIQYVSNDSEAIANPGEVTAKLEAAGCTAESRKMLGLDYPTEA